MLVRAQAASKTSSLVCPFRQAQHARARGVLSQTWLRAYLARQEIRQDRDELCFNRFLIGRVMFTRESFANLTNAVYLDLFIGRLKLQRGHHEQGDEHENVTKVDK